MMIADSIKKGSSVLVSGAAGTGKTTICLGAVPRTERTAICASTGIAAIRIKGQTIHSFSGIMSLPTVSKKAIQGMLAVNPLRANSIRNTDILFIDEIGMLSAKSFDAVDFICRVAKDRLAWPFGGMQLILSGDFYQLPPVPDLERGDEGLHVYKSRVWHNLNLKTHFLSETKRYQDLKLSKVVNLLARGECTQECTDMLHLLRSRPQPPPLLSTTICGTNQEVDYINSQCLDELPENPYSLRSTDINWSPGLDCMAPHILLLKPDSPILLTANIDVSKGLANGRQGIVKFINKAGGFLTIDFGGHLANVTPHQFYHQPHRFYRKNSSRSQYPVKLCWARTVHRTQGQTIDGPIHLCVTKMTQPGQLAVALSRTSDSQFVSMSGVVARPAKRREVDNSYQKIYNVGRKMPAKEDDQSELENYS